MSSSRALIDKVLTALQEINRAEIEADVVVMFVDRCQSSVSLEEARMLSSMQFIKRFGGPERQAINCLCSGFHHMLAYKGVR